jgi:hydroxymethylpyrimidine pyrophosphatase-like HAD family hydrolase
VTRVVLRCPAEEPEAFLEVVDRLGLQDVTYVVGHTAWLDLAPKGVSKASALEVVRQRLGVVPEATFAVGDGRNDIEMLQWAARGVAMGDAPAEVQDAADLVTETFDNDGLALALARWLPAVA